MWTHSSSTGLRNSVPDRPIPETPREDSEATLMGEETVQHEALATYIAVIDGHPRRARRAWRPRGARESLWRDRKLWLIKATAKPPVQAREEGMG